MLHHKPVISSEFYVPHSAELVASSFPPVLVFGPQNVQDASPAPEYDPSPHATHSPLPLSPKPAPQSVVGKIQIIARSSIRAYSRRASAAVRSQSDIYRPQRSCKGYVFTGVCLSTGGVCLSACWDTPPEQTPPQSRPSQSRHPPGADTPPQEQTHHPRSRHSPGADTPRSRHPPGIQPLLRTVHILLECILV